MTAKHLSLKLLKFVAWAALAWVVLCAAAWALLPGLIQSQAQTRLSALLGRPVAISAVRVKPWSLGLEIDGVTLAGSAAAQTKTEPSLASVNLAGLAVAVSGSSIWHRAWVIDRLDIDGLQVRITRLADGQYDIDDIVKRLLVLAAEPSEPGLPRIVLRGLQLRDAGLHFDDRLTAEVHKLEGLTLTLPLLSTLPDDAQLAIEPRIAGRLNGRPFDSSLQGTPFAPLRRGRWQIKLDALDLTAAARYVPATVPVRLASGLLSADLKLQVAQNKDKAWSVSISGEVGVQKLLLTGRDADSLRAGNVDRWHRSLQGSAKSPQRAS